VAKRKWKGTPAQRAALKKGQAALARWRKAHGKNPRGKGKRTKKFKRCKTKVAKSLRKKTKRQLVKRAAGNICAKSVFHRKKRSRNPQTPYFLKRGTRFFTGAGFGDKSKAVRYSNPAAAKTIAQKLANATGASIAVTNG
jgi:hypothetical protein